MEKEGVKMINKLLENERYEEALKLLQAPKTENEYCKSNL